MHFCPAFVYALLYAVFFDSQYFTNYFKNILIISLKRFAVSNKYIIFVVSIRQSN